MRLSEVLVSKGPLVSGEDVLRQGITIPRKNFLRYSLDFDFLFQGSESIALTRRNVFDYFQQDTARGIISSIVWGFPRGTLPGGRPLSAIFENLSFFKEVIEEIAREDLSEEKFELINSKAGIKNGATSKMLYFSGAKIGNIKCLIFDSRVRGNLLEHRPIEFNSTIEHLPRNSLYPGWNGYKAFCQEVKNLATQLCVTEDAIEMYLFNSAPNRRRAQHAMIE